MPDSLTVDLNGSLCRMRGTDHTPPRCAALVGVPGDRVSCGIHEWRPSPCREFGALAPLGIGDAGCDAARRRFGWPPLPGRAA